MPLREVRRPTRESLWLAGALAAVALFIIIVPAACTDRLGAQSALRKSGYTDIHTTGYRWFGSRDAFVTGFEATTPLGERVTGCVTSNFFGGSAIRLD